MSDTVTADAGSQAAAPHYLSKQPTGYPDVDMCRQRLARNQYNGDAWFSLLRAVKSTGNDKLIYDSFDDAIKQYPTSSQFLAKFAEFELSRGKNASAEAVFNNNLFNVPSLELWQCYLNYVLKSNANAHGVVESHDGRATVTDCYKLVLDNVGLDREAGGIWMDYINFLSTMQTSAPYEEHQKTKLLRETYQAAVVIPMAKVEEIWKQYDAFENRIDRATVKQMLSKLSPLYMAARAAYRETSKTWDSIRRTQPPRNLPVPPEWSLREVEFLDSWRKYLGWELSNPLHLEDPVLLHRRIVYAYNQACMALRFYPEIWIEFANYLQSRELTNEAIEKLQMASKVIPSSLAVQFAYAEMAERHRLPDVSKQVYTQVISLTRSDIDRTSQRYTRRLEKLNKQLTEPAASKNPANTDADGMQGFAEDDGEISELSEDSESGNSSNYNSDGYASDASDMDVVGSGGHEQTSQSKKALKMLKRRIAKTKSRMERRLKEKRETYTLSWIMYLRYAQRSEGIESVRQLLRKIRAEPAGYITYHVYVAVALMEYHIAKRPVIAGKLFELCAKTYSDQPEFISKYMDFLINSGDDTNARALFERFQSTSIGDSRHMWLVASDFEYNYGDMNAIAKLDKRFIDKFDHETLLTRMAARYSYMDVNGVAINEFGLPHRKDIRGGLSLGDSDGRRMAGSHDGHDLGALGNVSLRDDTPLSAGGLGVSVGSVAGRGTDKAQLLAPVNPNRYTKLSVANLEEYNPVIEAYTPAEFTQQYVTTPMSGSYGRPESREPITPLSVRPHVQLLEQGDILSYIAASVAAPDTTELDNQPLNVDALLDTIMQQDISAPRITSSYRPLAYMPWLNRNEPAHRQHHNQPYGGGGGGSYGRDRSSTRQYPPRSRSRGRRDSTEAEGYRGNSARGSNGGSSHYGNRHAPYARSNSRPSYRSNSSRGNERSSHR
ncbi:mRNA 3'-end-processing protein rna14 [Coemansia erecta]|uniref:mRNA 3'-end-processing protein rna14 n=1 Tax=Coemansia erecta TaxID=147472 RepID=A0A9W7Y6M2_9FUNG|nr:mRNA 3'-end-processing protein rna14 [Coemansia erecta]